MKDRAEALIAQRLAYEFLGTIFWEAPCEELVRRLVAEDLLVDWPFPSGDPDLEAGLGRMRASCREGAPGLVAALAEDHARLLVTPGEEFVRPWESVHRGEEHVLFDRETLEVEREYHRFGMSVPRPGVEPGDHLALELRFLAHLCALALAAIEREQHDALSRVTEAMGQFVQGHLERWAGECLRQLAENAGTEFYRGAAQVARACLAETARILSAWRAEAPGA